MAVDALTVVAHSRRDDKVIVIHRLAIWHSSFPFSRRIEDSDHLLLGWNSASWSNQGIIHRKNPSTCFTAGCCHQGICLWFHPWLSFKISESSEPMSSRTSHQISLISSDILRSRTRSWCLPSMFSKRCWVSIRIQRRWMICMSSESMDRSFCRNELLSLLLCCSLSSLRELKVPSERADRVWRAKWRHTSTETGCTSRVVCLPLSPAFLVVVSTKTFFVFENFCFQNTCLSFLRWRWSNRFCAVLFSQNSIGELLFKRLSRVLGHNFRTLKWSVRFRLILLVDFKFQIEILPWESKE